MYNNVNQTDMHWTAREIQNQARIALPAARIMALLLTASRGEGGRRAGPGIDPGPDEGQTAETLRDETDACSVFRSPGLAIGETRDPGMQPPSSQGGYQPETDVGN